MHVVQHVYQQPVPTTTPAPTTKSPNQYLYEPHSCPKMDVATWENEVVIYDNKNCAMYVYVTITFYTIFRKEFFSTKAKTDEKGN